MADRLDRYRRSSLGELLLAQQAAQAAIDSLPDPVVVFDANGEVLIVNRAAETLLGIEFGAAAAPRRSIAWTRRLRATIEQARGHVLGGKGAYVPRGFEEAVRVSADGEGDCYYLARATPVYGEEGGITGATVILQDVTRLHRFDQLKNDLVATVAHEFRTPLTSLRMAIHLCLEQHVGPLTDKQADLLYAARDDCERLQRIVDELLDLAKIQGGRMQLRRRRVAPRALIDDAIDAQSALAAERHVELVAEVAPALPELEVDRDRLQLVFANLLTNAIRHSPQGAAVRLRGARAERRRALRGARSRSGHRPRATRGHLREVRPGYDRARRRWPRPLHRTRDRHRARRADRRRQRSRPRQHVLVHGSDKDVTGARRRIRIDDRARWPTIAVLARWACAGSRCCAISRSSPACTGVCCAIPACRSGRRRCSSSASSTSLSPLDLIPDVLLGIGEVDDLVVLIVLCRLFIYLCPPEVVRDHVRRIGDEGR